MTNQDQLYKEQRILENLRKVISKIIRDTTPSPGMKHPLRSETLEDIRQSFILISAREREISEQLGHKPSESRPQYADQATKADNTPSTVHFINLNKERKKH